MLPIVIDNVLPNSLADEIEQDLFRDIAWYFNNDLTFADNLAKEHKVEGFSHLLFADGRPSSDRWPMLSIIPHMALAKANMNFNYTPARARAFLTLGTNSDQVVMHNKHVDLDWQHLVCLYYVNDSDGDTYFYGYNENDPVSQKVTPVKNRVVIFDGKVYHAGSSPKKSKRAIINFDLFEVPAK
jgi:hypothetical protein